LFRKTASGILLFLFLVSTLTLTFKIQPVQGYAISTLLTHLEYPKGLWVKGDKLWLTETAGRNTVGEERSVLTDMIS
jgi:hypothetical protein